MLYKIVRPFVKLFVRLCFHPKIINAENIPPSGPVILAGNHTSNFDALLLMSTTKRPISFLGKHTLPRFFVRYLHVIPVDRTKSRNPEALRLAREVLKEDNIVGIFPEGTINRTAELTMPFKMGAVSLAAKNSAPLVPFIITGKYALLKGNLKIKFLSPRQIMKDDIQYENARLMADIGSIIEREKNENN